MEQKSSLPRGSDTDRDTYVMSVDGANELSLTDTLAGNNGGGEWSPDSAQIVYASNQNGTFDLFIMDADGDNKRQLTFDNENDEFQPAWHPDGSTIGYTKRTLNHSSHQLWTVDVDGTNDALFCGITSGTDMEWSPNGAQVAYLSGVWPDLLWSIGSDCSNPNQLTANGDDVDIVAWSPDSDMLVYSADSGNYFIRPDDSDKQRLGHQWHASTVGGGSAIGFTKLHNYWRRSDRRWCPCTWCGGAN